MLKLGLVGIGRGRMVQSAARRADVRFEAVCDVQFADSAARDRLLAELKAGGMPFAYAYHDYDRFLEHDLDVVVVASPAPLHAAQSIAALRGGKDVICEVPAVMSLDEARDLVRAVRETRRRYLFAENCCYWGFVRAWRQMVDDGRIGTPFYAEGEYIHDVRFLMRDTTGQPTWRASFAPIRYCTHETGPLLDLLQDRGVSVTCLETGTSVAPEFPAADAGVALMSMGKGSVVKLLACFKNAVEPPYHRFLVFGTKGALETRTTEAVTHANLGDIPHLEGRVSLPLGTALRGSLSAGGHGGADAAMLDDFLDALARDLPLPIDVYRGLDYTLPGVCAVLSAAQGGMPVAIPDPRAFA
jgi:predicted dehydrogenase